MPGILIVEDYATVRSLLRDWLSAMFPECSFWEAKDAEEALTLTRAERPEVVLMDVRLPGTNGIEAARRIREAAPETQVVILTAYDAPEYRAEADAAGARAYVLKDRAHRELVPLLKELLPATGSGVPGSG